MSNLAQLRFKRGQAKASVTRVQKYFDAIDASNPTENDIIQLKLRLTRLDPIFAEFSIVQGDIEYEMEKEKASDDDIEKESEERERFETIYFDLIAKITNVICKFEAKQNAISEASDNASSHSGSLNHSIASSKLPAMNLPSFDGALDKWLDYRDIFLSVIEKDKNLDDTQKMYYLRCSLKGEAADIISSIPKTGENYRVAWETLIDRYENKEIIVFNYVQALFDAPTLSKESHTDLRKLYEVFNKNLS